MLTLFLSFVASQVQLSLTEERQFLQWMRTNNKFYVGDDYYLRLGIFISNARYCHEFNKRKGLTFRVGLNKFSCHTPSEYKSLLGSEKRGINRHSNNRISSQKKSAAPSSFDWRSKNVVNPIRDQSNCGSCWAFSAISTSESAFAIAKGDLLQLSEQNLIDCADYCNGCSGGFPTLGLNYVIDYQFGQFSSQIDYPYTATEGNCLFDSEKAIGQITYLVNVRENDEDDLKEKVAYYGVASVCIFANNAQFMSYSGGILDDDDCVNVNYVDHAVAVVGYGDEDGILYWIVRNSWGDSWGEDGYVRMIRNKDNRCLIASIAFVAVNTA